MKQKFLFFFLTAFLSLIGGGELWAASYIPSGTKTFTATTDIIVAGTDGSTANSVIAAGISDGWITIPAVSYNPKTPVTDSEIDTPTSDVYCLQVKSDGGTFKENKRVIHFKVTGITGVKAIGQANDGRGFQIGATEYVEGTTNENTTVNVVAGSSSAENPVSCSGLDKSNTYIISVFAYSSDTYLYAVRFISDPYVTSIGIGDLCYAVGTAGKNASSNGLDRAVGGFNLTFGGGEGIKYNGGNQLIARNNTGTITIALDDNNSKKNITKVVMTRSAAGSGTFTASDDATVTNSGTTITWQGTACKTITFTQTGDNVNITNIAITTDVAPTFEKVTPTVIISPTSASVKRGTAGTFTTTATVTPKNFNWTWTATPLTNVTYYTKSEGNADAIGEPGTFKTTAESTTTGDNTLVASFAGNNFFNAVADAATYTLTVSAPVASSSDNTVQTYPYTWDFTAGSTTWGNSSTQLPISDWEKGDETYYNYNVPNSETGFNIDAIKGLRFQSINYLGLDWGWGHVYLTGGQVIIPSVPKGMIIKINASNNGQGGSATITPTNATYSGEGTATVNSSYQDFTFVTSSEGSVTFTFSGVASIKSISVQKNDLTTFAFNNTESYYGKSEPTSSPSHSTGAYIGKTTTFKYKIGRDQVLRTRVDVAPGFTDTGIEVNTTNFSVSSNASTVLDASDYSLSKPSDSKIYYWGVKVKKPGTASLTYSFNGTSDYNAKNYTELFTIQKDDIDLTFASDFVEKTVGDAAFTNTFTLNGLTLPVMDEYAGTINTSSFTYEVKTVNDKQTSSIVSVSSTGEVTLSSPGAVLIHAKLASTDWYNGVDRKYTLVVNPSGGASPVLQWSDYVSGVSVPYNDAVSHTATGTVGDGQTIKYRSADTSVASVDATGKVTGTGVGSTTIYAYVEPTSTHNYAEISYSVTVTPAGELESFRFIPNNGKVNNGKSITPKLAFPTIPGDGVTSLKVTQVQVLERNGAAVSDAALTTNEAIAGCDIISIDEASDLRNNWVLNADGKVHKVNVTINGKAVGKAEITVTFTSTYYSTATATYTIEVTDASTRNFSWADESGSPEYYTYAGDFMMLPAITGNSNGNNNYSNGAKNSASYSEGGTSYSALQKYKYEIKNGKITWNNKDIKIGEGFPDFEIVTDGISSPGVAAVFFGRGEGSSHPDTIMVYCETAGDVKLRAYDPQDHTKYCDATIHILPINDIEGSNGAATNVTGSMTYPYTWDFTTNFDMSVVGETDRYWTSIKDSSGDPTGDYTNGYGFFNLDWADTNNNNNTGDRIYKYFIAGAGSSATGYMHEFNGMMLKLKGSTSWANKRDRMRILAYDNTNQKGRLQFNGGPHYMKLYLPVAANRPSSFKIFVKAEGSGSVNINENENTKQNLSATAQIYSFDSSDITTTGDNCVILGFENARVSWIAMSTEAKAVNKPDINKNLTYAASSYAYKKALDLSKSEEANKGLEVYYASGFNKGYGASASAGSAVVLTRMTTDSKPVVEANTGLILKAANALDSYMIAHAENAESPVTPSVFTGEGAATNYLVAGPGARVNSSVGTGNDIKTNFVISHAYRQFTENTSSAVSGYLYDRNWSFYKIIPYVDVPSSSAYLSIPGNLYVNKDGEIVERASSARAAFGVESAADDDTAEAPASKLMLDIIFQETSNTATDDPATEDPESPLPPDVINGIDNVKTDEADKAVWHSMEGVRISQPTKPGLYIRNGKKVVIK